MRMGPLGGVRGAHPRPRRVTVLRDEHPVDEAVHRLRAEPREEHAPVLLDPHRVPSRPQNLSNEKAPRCCSCVPTTRLMITRSTCHRVEG